MRVLTALAGFGFAMGVLAAQSNCPATPVYSGCDMIFELNDQEAAAHPNPYLSVELRAEFRGPRHRTYLLPAFWNGGRTLVIRMVPNEEGQWDYHLTSNIERFNDKEGSLQATASASHGYVRPANLHHWATLAGENISMVKPHLWMGDTCYRFGFLSDEQFRALVEARADQKFTHLRGIAIGTAADSAAVYAGPDHPRPEYFQKLDERIRALNAKGITVDLLLAGPDNALTKLFPESEQRQRYVRYLIARYASMDITWQGIGNFESYDRGRTLMKEIGTELKSSDPFGHPRTSEPHTTSAPLMGDGWMNFITYQSSNDQLGAIEHQLYPTPFVNLNFGLEGNGGLDADSFRHRLWNSTMNGQYPTYGNTATAMSGGTAFDAAALTSPGAQQMSHWFKFFDDTRHWELEPYFDVDGGRALALEGVEYIVYIEKPGPVEVTIEKHGYDVSWFNPITGETVPEKKYKGEKWTGEPPDNSHDWVLHIEREGRKESMLNSYKFTSREYPLQLQEPETMPKLTPFTVVEPEGDTIAASKPVNFEVKIKRETRGTRSMMYLWTGDVPTEGRGFRVLATGRQGTFELPPALAKTAPNVLALRVAAMNANGKVYLLDKVYKLVP